MLTTAVRMYGAQDLRLETFELPPIREDEILVRIVSDSLCMSSYKAARQGKAHKRVPEDIDVNPVIIGHEFCGDIIEVGAKWRNQFQPGEKYVIQPAINYKGSLHSPGYSFPTIGGNATYGIMPHEVMEMGCLLPYGADAYFTGSLAEPMSCIVGAYHAQYHTQPGVYRHDMGIREDGNMAILAGVGPMGLGAIDYALHCDRRPGLLVVSDIDAARLSRAEALFTVAHAAQMGVRLVYLNTKDVQNPQKKLLALTDGNGYDDVFVFAPVAPLVESGGAILGRDGCLNFFAGPTSPDFSAKMNFYDVHYAATHVVGTSGGNTDDMIESLQMTASGQLMPAVMVTHVGGLNAAIETTLNLPNIPGGKKLIYTHVDMPLTAVDEFDALRGSDERFSALSDICKHHNGLWNAEAEAYLLEHPKAANV